jgi:SAM-dependent methyltransferase
MSIGPGAGAASELDILRREYESSLSWRLTRPVRALGRVRRRVTRAPRPEPEAAVLGPGRYDAWLEHFHGDRLARIDAACEGGGRERLALFRELEDDVWALLLTQEYATFPHIRRLLPDVPDPSLQELWNGASGARLAAQSSAFYARLRARFAEHGAVALRDARVLDFGCGWGRLTRYIARDVAPGRLYGCDPVEGILAVCRDCRVPAELAVSDFLPERLPFDGRFDLVFAFSVFTHLSERAHHACLDALHGSLAPGGMLVVTIRPPEYARLCAALHPALRALGPDPFMRLAEPRHLFAPHPADASHPQYRAGEMTYGEAVITLPYVRERWSDRFELLAVDLLVGDLYQVMLTLRAL